MLFKDTKQSSKQLLGNMEIFGEFQYLYTLVNEVSMLHINQQMSSCYFQSLNKNLESGYKGLSQQYMTESWKYVFQIRHLKPQILSFLPDVNNMIGKLNKPTQTVNIM